MFFGIVLMFVAKDFVRDCFVAQIRAKMCVRAGIRASLREEVVMRARMTQIRENIPDSESGTFGLAKSNKRFPAA